MIHMLVLQRFCVISSLYCELAVIFYHARIQKVLSEGVQLSQVCLVDGPREDPSTTISGPSSFKWRLAGVPMMAQH